MNEQRGHLASKFYSFWLVILTILLIPFLLFSKSSININDSIINRGIVSQIPIYGTLSETNVNSLKIIIEFNALSLDIKSATGNENFIMKCGNPDIKINMEDITKSSLTITCNDIQPLENGIYCILNVEGLAGPDTTSLINPLKMIINGSELTETELKSGSITIPGIPVFQDYPESIGNNYPNPFNGETKFPISIHKPTNLKFFIYSTDGRMILSNEQENEMLELSLFKNKTEITIVNLNNKLDRGNYILKLSPDNMRFASGEYYLFMVTDLGVYYKNFIYLK